MKSLEEYYKMPIDKVKDEIETRQFILKETKCEKERYELEFLKDIYNQLLENLKKQVHLPFQR